MAPQFLSPVINTSIKETELYSNDKSITNNLLRNSLIKFWFTIFIKVATLSFIDQSEKKI